MTASTKYILDFLAREYPELKISYMQTAKSGEYGQFKFRITGMAGAEKIKIFSHYKPSQLAKELDNGYKLVFKKENGILIIDLKKV